MRVAAVQQQFLDMFYRYRVGAIVNALAAAVVEPTQYNARAFHEDMACKYNACELMTFCVMKHGPLAQQAMLRFDILAKVRSHLQPSPCERFAERRRCAQVAALIKHHGVKLDVILSGLRLFRTVLGMGKEPLIARIRRACSLAGARTAPRLPLSRASMWLRAGTSGSWTP